MSYARELLQYEVGRKRRERDLIDKNSKIWDLLTSEIEDLERALHLLED
jgi:hypothetical protein